MRKTVKPSFPKSLRKNLLICPFCQQDPEEYEVGARSHYHQSGTWYVRCLTNGCAMQNTPILKHRWNERV